MSSKVTWGLAWTGLALVLIVPSADFVTGMFGGSGTKTVMTSDVEPVKTAAISPAAPAKTTEVTTIKTDRGVTIVPAGSTPPATNDPVEKYLSTGKPLPDYITDDKAAATAPAPSEDETQVAAVTPEPVMVPRLPLPAAARPIAVVPKAPAPASAEPVVIVDESALTGSISTPTGPVPPAPIVDDAANWDDESLRRYLERRGILEGGAVDDNRSSATVTQSGSGDYDPDGFYLSDGPNGDRAARASRRDRILRMLEENDGDPSGFTLF